MHEAPEKRAPFIVCLCVIAVLASGAWLVMLFLVAGVAMLVSMAGGDLVVWLIRAPAVVLLVSWALGSILVRLGNRRGGRNAG
jgi:hypothetical protein